MKKYYIFTMAVAFLLGSIGVTLWLILDIKAGAVVTIIALLTGAVASVMRPSSRRIGVLDFITTLAKKGKTTTQNKDNK